MAEIKSFATPGAYSPSRPMDKPRLFANIGDAYVRIRAVLAYQSKNPRQTTLFLESGHTIVVELPVHNVRTILEEAL